jgi:hypothetical protein
VALVGLSLAATRGTAAAACHSTCTAQLAECKRTCPGGGQVRRDCRAACAERSTCTAPGARIRTLAYVVNECRGDARGTVLRQALRIRRGDCAPVTVLEFPFGERWEDAGYWCRNLAGVRHGGNAVIIGNFQRLGATPDGSGLVFEVTNDQVLTPGLPAVPEQEGIFYVRSDGRGLRRLGPASRDPTWRVFLESNPYGGGNVNSSGWTLRFSPNGRTVVYTDVGPGPAGEDAVQIVTLDLASGSRRKVTRLPTARPVDPSDPVTGFPRFLDDETIVFFTYANPDGLHPGGAFFTVNTDGTGLKALPIAVALPGGQIVPRFGITGGRSGVLTLDLPGTPVNSVFTFPPRISEVFLLDGKNLLQLTNFRRVDTGRGFLSADGRRVFFTASADPLGANPSENCQLFSIDRVGAHLRQVTRFREVDRSVAGCSNIPPGCNVNVTTQDPVTRTIVFQSSCDPLGTTPNGGSQIFAMRPDGSRLRQLTDTRGVVRGTDGSLTMELPGPWAYSAPSVLVRGEL